MSGGLWCFHMLIYIAIHLFALGRVTRGIPWTGCQPKYITIKYINIGPLAHILTTNG